VRSHIEISQGLPEAAKAGIAGQIARQVSAAFPGAAAEMLETVAAGVSAELETLLTLPLIEQLSQGMEEGAQKIVRRIGPLTADQAHGFGAALERAFHKGWGRHFSYKAKLMRRILNAAARRMPASIGEQIALPVPDMHNIYIPTAAQKKYLAAQLRARLEAALVAQSAGPKKSLSAVFNCVASPFTAWRLRRAGARAGGFILAGAVMQLNREHATGDSLSRRLSGGEQQRLGFARILLHKPEIVLLDEVTASLDPAAGSRLYSEIVAKLPDALIISVAHNMHVRAFHTLHARVEDKGLVIEKVLPEKTAKPGPAAPGPAQGA
jgi:ABC-type polar amino acid transport system ATPase subunit